MHLYFYIRGVKQQCDLFVSLAQGQFFQWDRKNLLTGQMETTLVQCGLRQSVLGAQALIFPKECLAEVIAMLGLTRLDHEGNYIIGVAPEWKHSFKLAVLRKIFDAQPIPKDVYEAAKKCPTSYKLQGSKRGLSHLIIDGVSIHPIGIKEDDMGIMHTKVDPITNKEEYFAEGYEQEML